MINELLAEKSLLEDQLRQSEEERDKLRREIASMKKEAASSWTLERMENAMLRERIEDIAIEVMRFTSLLEGSSSASNTIQASEANRFEASRGALTDRLRSLQGRKIS